MQHRLPEPLEIGNDPGTDVRARRRNSFSDLVRGRLLRRVLCAYHIDRFRRSNCHLQQHRCSGVAVPARLRRVPARGTVRRRAGTRALRPAEARTPEPRPARRVLWVDLDHAFRGL